MAPKGSKDAKIECTKGHVRGRSPRDNGGSASAGTEPDDVGAGFAAGFDEEWTAKLDGKLDLFKGEVKGVVKNLVVAELEKFEAKIDAKFAVQATEVHAVKDAVDRIEAALASRGSASAGPDEAAVPFPPPTHPSYARAAAASPPAPFPGPPPIRTQNVSPEEFNQSKFWRRPDEAVVFANTLANAKVELSKWKKSITELASECDLASNLFKITGDPLGSRLEVRFLGGIDTAASSAKQFLDSLKLGGGKYKEQSVPSPDGQPIQFYLNPDKPACQVRKEILGKTLFDILKALKPDSDFTLQRVEAKIWSDKRPLCTVKILSETEARISWLDSRRVQLGIELADVEPAFSQAIADKGEKWT